ncbi:hypothetical protein Tco_0442461 [Tanacetum coccineum]
MKKTQSPRVLSRITRHVTHSKSLFPAMERVHDLGLHIDGEGNGASEVPETIFKNSDGMKERQSEDPFGLYSILNKNKVKSDVIREVNDENPSLKYPPGFTPSVEKNGSKSKDDQVQNISDNQLNGDNESVHQVEREDNRNSDDQQKRPELWINRDDGFKLALNSSKGSILVNGSPTEEFQFNKGVKQGMFTGIKLSSSLNIPHPLLCADERQYFMGQWNDSNILTPLFHGLVTPFVRNPREVGEEFQLDNLSRLVSTITLSSAVDRQLARKISSSVECGTLKILLDEEKVHLVVSLRLHANLKAGVRNALYCFMVVGLGCSVNKILFEKDPPSRRGFLITLFKFLYTGVRLRCKASFKWIELAQKPVS